MQITVFDTNVFGLSEPVFVKSKHSDIGFCNDDVWTVRPTRALNLPDKTHFCTACGKIVSFGDLDEYNRYWGYSGSDEVTDED